MLELPVDVGDHLLIWVDSTLMWGDCTLMRVDRQFIQGDPNQNFPFPKPVTLKVFTSDPKLVKPKLV